MESIYYGKEHKCTRSRAASHSHRAGVTLVGAAQHNGQLGRNPLLMWPLSRSGARYRLHRLQTPREPFSGAKSVRPSGECGGRHRREGSPSPPGPRDSAPGLGTGPRAADGDARPGARAPHQRPAPRLRPLAASPPDSQSSPLLARTPPQRPSLPLPQLFPPSL